MGQAEFARLLTRNLLGIVDLAPEQISALYSHFQLLLKWNQRINLTSVRSPVEMVTRHYCESLFFAAKVPDAEDRRTFLDLGSGAGFPGLPMAILESDWRVTLLEAHKRKSVFLREAARDLPNVEVLAKRAEDVEHHYDWLVSRAVRIEDVLSQIPRLSGNIGFLISEVDMPLIRGCHDVQWEEPIRLPWSERRVCVFGSFCPSSS